MGIKTNINQLINLSSVRLQTKTHSSGLIPYILASLTCPDSSALTVHLQLRQLLKKVKLKSSAAERQTDTFRSDSGPGWADSDPESVFIFPGPRLGLY